MKRTVKKPDERREDILQAARELFLTKEYDKTTMQDIMHKLNIAKGTIYHYFASKEAILEAVVEMIVGEELQRKKRLMESDRCRDLDALAKLRLLTASDHLAEDNDKILDHLHHPSNSVMHTRQLGRYLDQLAPIYAAVFEEGCRQGVFRTDHPLECAEFVLAGFQFLTDIGCYPWGEAQIARRMAAFPALLESQLSAPKGSFDYLLEQMS